MAKPETKARAGEELSPAEELKSALAGFVSEFKSFSTDIQSRIDKQDERMTKLDRKTMMQGSARPALSATAETEAPHQKAFAAYLRSGEDDGLRGLELEGKAMSTAVAADGGYLVAPQIADTIRSVLAGGQSLRSVANVVEVNATSYDVLVDQADIGAGWASELTASGETDTPQIERITIPVHELSAMPRASQRLLDDTAFDLEGWLAGAVASKFARTESAAFISGDGTEKPTGLLSHPIVDNAAWTWGNIGYVASGVDGDLTDADKLIDLVYALGAEYRANATFVMNSKTVSVVRKMKDADGRFLWSDGMAAGEPARLLGHPVLICEDMPDIAIDSASIAFGDFGAGYTVVERPDLRVLRDPFSAKPHVLFYASKRVGGDVSDFAAIKMMKFSVS